jgi:hypothetical protein
LCFVEQTRSNFWLILPEQTIIAQTKQWIKSVVIGCHFCPFAAPVISADSISYIVVPNASNRQYLDALHKTFKELDTHRETETALLIFPDALLQFSAYLNFVKRAEAFLKTKGYEGIYQLASFHPDYFFAGAAEEDAANYTNRSIYPMLHILREKGLSKAVANFPEPEKIPERNMAFARKKGLEYMKALRESCINI